MKCPACGCDIPDENMELCPHCGSPFFRGAEESDALSNNGDGTDLRLKELIEDVKRSLEELSGEAGPQEAHPPTDNLSHVLEQAVSNSPPSAAQKEKADREELCSFDLQTTLDLNSEPENSESVSQENLASVITALDRVLPQEQEQQSLPKRKARPLAIAAACAAIAVLIFVMIDFRHTLFTSPTTRKKPAVTCRTPSEKPSAVQWEKAQEPTPPVPARPVVPSDNLTQQAQEPPKDQEYAAPHPQGDNTTTQPLGEESSRQIAPQATEPQHFFTLHTDSYRSEHKAEREAQRLRNLGRDAFVQVYDSSESGRWYRVMIGKFSTREDATAALEDVRHTLKKNDCRVVRLPK